MPDVSIYVAIITAAAGVLGATIPQVAMYRRDTRQAEWDRRDRRAETKRQACLDLLRAAGQLRTRVADAAQYHGDEMRGKLAAVRKSAAAVELLIVTAILPIAVFVRHHVKRKLRQQQRSGRNETAGAQIPIPDTPPALPPARSSVGYTTSAMVRVSRMTAQKER
jgi:hypothetical protein